MQQRNTGAKQYDLYSPLPPSNIRLLRFNRHIIAQEVGDLEVAALGSTPPYYTLSHVWGRDVRDTSVQVGGHTILVSRNLANGIWRLRELAAKTIDKTIDMDPPLEYIWIDIICINQGDLFERSHQVSIMGQIYSGSIRTLVWLGNESKSSSDGWQLVKRIYNVFMDEYPHGKSDDIPRQSYSDSIHTSSGLPRWDSYLWVGLKEVFELQWFLRIWVVQEVVLSPKDPVILHGDSIYSWHHLSCAATWLRQKGYIRRGLINESLLNVDTMSRLRRPGPRWPLDSLMSITQIKFRAKDQRDKVYALLGIAAETQSHEQLPGPLQPDYNLPVSDVYQKVARYLLEQRGSLAMLTRTRGTSDCLDRMQREYDLKDIASWVPDWSDFRCFNRELRTSFSWVDYSDALKPARLGFPERYNASMGLKLKLSDHYDPSVLQVGGILIDEVAHVISFNQKAFSRKDFDDDVFQGRLRHIYETAMSFMGKEEDIVSWTKRFIRATTAEQEFGSGHGPDETLKDGMAYLHDLMSICGNSQTSDQLEHLSSGGNPQEYKTLASHFCFNRSFVITEAGRMGIGPSGTHVGDNIAVLFGGGVPYILRRQEAGWAFVGESYIHRLMEGEAVRAFRDRLVKEEILGLR